jgi:hypothetical protein
MSKRYLIFFLICFSFVSTLLQLLLSWQHDQLVQTHKSETRILHHSIADRFNLLLDSHRAIGIVTSEYLANDKVNKAEYQELVSNILRSFDEILGINIMNSKGVIVRVSPETSNRLALGKTTQNISELLDSSMKREPFWLSPPFKLFQGEMGFAFYMPFYKEGTLVGWVAPVISQEVFFNKFINSDFLKNYHFIIKDNHTKRAYFSTENLPNSRTDLYVNTLEIWGRKISFTSWPIKSEPNSRNQLFISLSIALIISCLTTFSLWLYDQRLRTKKQLESLGSLLRLTVQDTNQSLLSIHNQLNQLKLGTSPIQLDRVIRHVNYISTLLRQIDVLQKLAGEINTSEFVKTQVLPMILELTELFNEDLNDKKLVFDFDPQEMSRIEVLADTWLLCHSVFAHFIKLAIKLANSETDIRLKHYRENNYRCFTIQYVGPDLSDDLIQGKMNDEGSFVAEKVIEIHQGKLNFANTQTGGMVTIKLPIPK